MPESARLAEAFGRLGVGPGAFAVLYRRDHNVFAARLWWMLRAIGFDDAAVLDGGLARWMKEGRPVTGDVPRRAPARLEPRPRPGFFVGKTAVRAALDDPGVVLVNALSAEQHTGRGGVRPTGVRGGSREACRSRPAP